MSRLTVGHVWHRYPMIEHLFDAEERRIERADDLEGIDLLIFWGGTDIDSAFYKERNLYSGSPDIGRDRFEYFIWKQSTGKIPTLGICRGAQLMCALTGGSLWQHVDGHVHDHLIRTIDGSIINVSSTHHQMMRPAKHHEVVAVSKDILSPHKKSEKGIEHSDSPEPEVCFDPGCKTLMIQGHPEYEKYSAFREYTKRLIQKYLGVGK